MIGRLRKPFTYLLTYLGFITSRSAVQPGFVIRQSIFYCLQWNFSCR